MLAFGCPLVFVQQDHPPLKKNMEYVKWLVPIMPGWRSHVYLLIRRSSWRMVTLLPTRPNELQLRRTNRSPFSCCDARVQCCSRILFGEFHFCKSVIYMDHVCACWNCQFIVQFALYKSHFCICANRGAQLDFNGNCTKCSWIHWIIHFHHKKGGADMFKALQHIKVKSYKLRTNLVDFGGTAQKE